MDNKRPLTESEEIENLKKKYIKNGRYTELEYGTNDDDIVPEQANYVSCIPIYDKPPDFKRNKVGGYYYDEYCVILETTYRCKLRIATNNYLKNTSEDSLINYLYWYNYHNNMISRGLSQPPYPHI